MKFWSRKTKGITLIEILVVATIVAVLAVLGGANYRATQKRARDARRKMDLEQIRSTLEMYKADNNGRYPTSTGWVTSGSGTEWISGLVPDYISSLPRDPMENGFSPLSGSNGFTYLYLSDSSYDASGCVIGGKHYVLVSNNEMGECKTGKIGTGETGTPCDGSWIGSNCIYFVTNP